MTGNDKPKYPPRCGESTISRMYSSLGRAAGHAPWTPSCQSKRESDEATADCSDRALPMPSFYFWDNIQAWASLNPTACCFLTSIIVLKMQLNFRVNLLASFWSIPRYILGPKSVQKLTQNINLFMSTFRTFIFEVLKIFKCLLNVFLSLLCSSWGPARFEQYGFCER